MVDVRKILLKMHNGKCVKCKIAEGVSGYYDTKKEFVICDEFMLDYAIKMKFEIIKIRLVIANRYGIVKSDKVKDLIPLCVRCHLKAQNDFRIMRNKVNGIIYPKK